MVMPATTSADEWKWSHGKNEGAIFMLDNYGKYGEVPVKQSADAEALKKEFRKKYSDGRHKFVRGTVKDMSEWEWSHSSRFFCLFDTKRGGEGEGAGMYISNKGAYLEKLAERMNADSPGRYAVLRGNADS